MDFVTVQVFQKETAIVMVVKKMYAVSVMVMVFQKDSVAVLEIDLIVKMNVVEDLVLMNVVYVMVMVLLHQPAIVMVM